MPTKTESQLTFNQLPLDRLLSPGSQAGRQFVTRMAKQIDGAQRTIWVELLSLPDQTHPQLLLQSQTGHGILLPNTTSRRRKGVGKTETEKPITPIPSPTDVFGKESFSEASTKYGSGNAGQGLKCPFTAHSKVGYSHASIKEPL